MNQDPRPDPDPDLDRDLLSLDGRSGRRFTYHMSQIRPESECTHG